MWKLAHALPGFFGHLRQIREPREAGLFALNRLFHHLTGGDARPPELPISEAAQELLALRLARSVIGEEMQRILAEGCWETFPLFLPFTGWHENATRCPGTRDVLARVPNLCCAFFSVLDSQEDIPLHCGPMVGRLRCHLALTVPAHEPPVLRLRDGDRHWREGELIVFDDSLPHSVRRGHGARALLVVDIFRPLPRPFGWLNRLATRRLLGSLPCLAQPTERAPHSEEAARARQEHRKVERAWVDPRITYPCYKSFDEIVDVERLKALDGYLRERIERHARADGGELFTTGALKLDPTSPTAPGSRIIWLSRNTRPFRYLDLNHPEHWSRTPEAEEFKPLMDLIDTFPFQGLGRMMIMYDYSGRPVTAHRDHSRIDLCHDFIWFRTNLNKPFYVLNHRTGVRQYVASYTAWFDSCNQFHGADGHEGLSFSIRVDGVFTDEFRSRIPKPASNAASTPALWACLENAR